MSFSRMTRRDLLRTFSGIALAATSAVLVTISLSPFNLSFLIFFAFVPMIFAQYVLLPEKLSSLAPAITIGGFLGLYLGGVFSPFSAWYMKAIPLFIGVVTFFTDKGKVSLHRATNFKWFVADGVASWVGIEFIRMFIPAFGTWAFVSYALYNQPWFLQPVKVVSIFGLSILIMLFNYCLGWLVVNPSFGAKRAVLSACLIVIVWSAASLAMFERNSGEYVTIGVIQANPFEIAKSQSFRENLTKKLLTLSKEAASKGAEFVVWPEGALDYDPEVHNRDVFIQLAKETDAYLVIPYIVFGENGNRNEVKLLSPKGEFLGYFGKDHPVVFAGETSRTRGTYPVFETEHGTVGMVICYDLDFTDTVRKVARNGAKLIFAPSGDWPEIALKHYTHAVFRAVENRVSVVKAEWAFDSVIYDPYGRVVAKQVSTKPTEAVLVADVPLGEGNTLYSRTGDFLGLASLVMMFFVQVALAVENKRKRNKISRGTDENKKG